MYLLLVDHNFITSSELQEMIEQTPADREIVNCYSQETLLKIAGKISPEIVIIDFDLVKGDQASFFKSLHMKKMDAHIMVLINPDHYEDLYSAIELGAIDDYMVKPVQKEEFLARIKLAALREKQPAKKEELTVWPAQQEKEEPEKISEEEPGEPDYIIPEIDRESYKLDEAIDLEPDSLEARPEYESDSMFRDSDLKEEDLIKTEESDQEEPAVQESAVEEEPLSEKWVSDEFDFEPKAPQEHEEEEPGKSSLLDDLDLFEQKEDMDLEQKEPQPEEGFNFDDLKLEKDDEGDTGELFDEPALQEEEAESPQDQGQEDLLSLFDDVDSIFNSKSGPEDEIFTPDRGTGVFEKAETEAEPPEEIKEQALPEPEPQSDFDPGPVMARPTDKLFGEPEKPDRSKSTSPLPEEKQFFDDLFEDDVSEDLKEEPRESFYHSDPDFKTQSTFEDNDFSELPSQMDDEALFFPEADDGTEEDFFKQEPQVTAEEMRKRSALPGRSADDYLFGENGEKEPIPDLPDWIEEQVEYDWRQDLEKKEEIKEEVKEEDQENLYQERDISRRKRKSRSSHKRFFSIFGNVLFILLLLSMASISFLLIQSRIIGGVPQVAGYQMYIVLSGSMSPEFDTGSLAFVRDIEPLQLMEGDIITFESPNNPASLTTHRIVEIQREDGLKFITRGDANNINDPNPVPADNVVGIVTGSVPYVGYVLNFAQTTQGLVLLIFIPGILIILFELSKIVRYLSQGEGGSKRNRDGDYGPLAESKR